VTHLEGRVPKVARLLLEAEPDLLAFHSFPAAHRSKLRSTNPLERVNREIGRRTDVVGVFPNDAALLRLAGSLLIEQTMSGWSAAATSARPPWLSSRPPTRPRPERSCRSHRRIDDAEL
jgi:transposase-like protein